MKTIYQHDNLLVKPYIDTKVKNALEKIAPVEVSPSANAYSVGKQLIYNSVLYDVISAIAVDDLLTVGTNIAVAKNIRTQIQTLTNQVADMNNVLGAKNLLPPAHTQTNANVTYTVNDDGSVTINGTRSSAGGIILNDEIVLKAGETYVYSIGNPFNLSNTAGSNIEGYDGSSWVSVGVNVYGTETIGEFTASNTYSKYRVKINANNGVVFSNLTIYPMICLKSNYDLDSSYQPYAKTNRQLTEDTTGLLDNLEVNGAVNMLYANQSTNVNAGITYTLNDDNSLSVVGTPTGGGGFQYVNINASEYVGKTLKFKANPSGKYADAKFYIALICRATMTSTNLLKEDLQLGGSNYKDEYTFTVPNGTGVIIVGFNMASDATSAINLTYKPMLTVSSYNGDYVPYAMSNKELTVRTDSKFRRTRRDITNYLDNLVTAIAAQDLESYGYSIGDWFVGASGYKYHLADPNPFYGGYSSYAVVDTAHIGIVVQTGASSKWNDTDNTSTGYSGSVLHSYLTTTVLNNIKSDMIALFGGTTGLEHLLSHQKLLTTAVSSWAWQTNQYISALSEVQVYNSRVWGIDGYQTGEANKPLQIFQKYRFNEVFGNIWFWLRDIVSASYACRASGSGGAHSNAASASDGVVGLILFH